MGKVHLEVLPALAESLGIDSTSEEVISEPEIEEAGSVRSLLNRLGDRHQHFRQIVLDSTTQRLTGRVVIFLNGRDLELVDGLETRLNDGDTLTLVPFIAGG